MIKTSACLRVCVNIGSISIPAFSQKVVRDQLISSVDLFINLFLPLTRRYANRTGLCVYPARVCVCPVRVRITPIFLSTYFLRTHANRTGLCVYPVRVCVCPVRVRITQNFLSTYFSPRTGLCRARTTFPHTFSRQRLCINQALDFHRLGL